MAIRPSAVQAFFTQKLLQMWLTDDFYTLLNRRACTLIGEPVASEEWEKASCLARQIASARHAMPTAAYAFWQQALGMWPTARRYQQEQLFCIFGCPVDVARDEQKHYLSCGRALAIVNAITKPPSLPDCPRTRLLGGVTPTLHGMLQTAVLTRLYRLRLDPALFAKMQQLHTSRSLVALHALMCREGHAIAHDLGIAGPRAAIFL